uniref:OO_Ba0005L10-OO_Ba0081K17.14 protein n=1 Tax=Oryza officinalis TaxID=4535 RepID=D0ABB8_9ORYZ|nr:OO_Ba0005L10-OO_Ba0081K17.14 [Oryza officinalis]
MAASSSSWVLMACSLLHLLLVPCVSAEIKAAVGLSQVGNGASSPMVAPIGKSLDCAIFFFFLE